MKAGSVVAVTSASAVVSLFLLIKYAPAISATSNRTAIKVPARKTGLLGFGAGASLRTALAFLGADFFGVDVVLLAIMLLASLAAGVP
jgi:hypothetical protein